MWRKGKHSIVQWLGLSLLVSLSLWTVTFTGVSHFLFVCLFFSPPLGGMEWLEYFGVRYFSSLGRLVWSAVKNFPSPRSVRLWWFPSTVPLWLSSFPWGQALLCGAEYFGLFQNGSFSSTLAGRRKGFFSDISCENSV